MNPPYVCASAMVGASHDKRSSVSGKFYELQYLLCLSIGIIHQATISKKARRQPAFLSHERRGNPVGQASACPGFAYLNEKRNPTGRSLSYFFLRRALPAILGMK
jgi:hypothetical protein